MKKTVPFAVIILAIAALVYFVIGGPAAEISAGIATFAFAPWMLWAALLALALGCLAGLVTAWTDWSTLVSCSAQMRSTDFRAVVEPILNEVFDGVYDQRDDEFKEYVKVRDGIARAYHEEPVLYGLPAAPEMPDGQPVTFGQGGTFYIYRYQYLVFGLAFALTKVLVEDGDHIRIGKVFSEHLAQSMAETKEIYCAQLLNRAFNSAYTFGDGVSMCNSAHPLVTGTASNVLTTPAALSQTSVEQMLIQIRSAVDSAGKKIRLKPRRLVVPPQLMLQAQVIIKSVLRTGTMNNDLNPVKSLGLLDEEPSVVSRMTSTTNWFVKNDVQRGLTLMMRRKLEKSMEGDFDTDSMKYKATERYIPGMTDWRDIFGTPGL